MDFWAKSSQRWNVMRLEDGRAKNVERFDCGSAQIAANRRTLADDCAPPEMSGTATPMAVEDKATFIANAPRKNRKCLLWLGISG